MVFFEAPHRIAAAILNDIGPEIADAGVDRIKSYVGKGARFKNWDEAADAVAANNAHAFENYGHGDWVKMAQRNCREENGSKPRGRRRMSTCGLSSRRSRRSRCW